MSAACRDHYEAEHDSRKVRVMVAGDTHGDGEWAETLTKLAGRHGASAVIQVGDFGFWPRMATKSGRSHAEYYLGRINAACGRWDVAKWIFIDGNHDDHFSLAQKEVDLDGFKHLDPRVYYAPRGHRFEIAGVRFGALGGAVSLDAWAERSGYVFGGTPYQAGWDWFPTDEAPTLNDVTRLIDGGTLDVLLTHDSPFGVDLTRFEGFKGVLFEPEVMMAAKEARVFVAGAAVATHAPLLIHGHWHARHTSHLAVGDYACQVEGLASNSVNYGRDARAYLFLDLDPSAPEGQRVTVTDGRKRASLPSLQSTDNSEE